MSNKVVVNKCYGGFGLSREAAREIAKRKGLPFVECKHSFYIDSGGVELARHDKDLVDVVESLGDLANGMCSKLKVIIIKGSQYRIDEYDGMETLIVPDEQEWVCIV